ncbi:hypothetical protein H4582DRAFT_1904161, partial [Lactarius indigo]
MGQATVDNLKAYSGGVYGTTVQYIVMPYLEGMACICFLTLHLSIITSCSYLWSCYLIPILIARAQTNLSVISPVLYFLHH